MVRVGHALVVHAGIEARVVKVYVRPLPVSVTLIGNTVEDGAATVIPEAVHVGTVTPGQKGEHIPPKHPLQFNVVVVLDQV